MVNLVKSIVQSRCIDIRRGKKGTRFESKHPSDWTCWNVKR